MPTHPEAFARVRTLNQAIAVTPADLAGPFMNRLGAVHRKQELGVFASQGASGGSPWAALSPAYRAAKKLLYPGKKILVRTGAMKEALTKAKNPDYIQRYIKPYLQFGTASTVASYHRSGTRTMPRREPVPKSVGHLEEMRREIVLWYRDRWDQVMRGAAALRRGQA